LRISFDNQKGVEAGTWTLGLVSSHWVRYDCGMNAYNIRETNINRLGRSRFARMLAPFMRGLSKTTEFLVPGSCIICDAGVEAQGGCCANCWKQINFIAEPRCPVMGTPFSVEMVQSVAYCPMLSANPFKTHVSNKNIPMLFYAVLYNA